MAEPVSSGAGAVAIKMHGLGVFIAVVIALGYLVVVMTRMPRSRSEWVVSLITTVIGGIFFASGLPFWAIARWFFKYVNDREGKNILDVAKEVKDFKDNF